MAKKIAIKAYERRERAIIEIIGNRFIDGCKYSFQSLKLQYIFFLEHGLHKAAISSEKASPMCENHTEVLDFATKRRTL
jgi:hypothetical protein